MYVATNPLSLKQLCRIEIRKRLMLKMKDSDYVKTILLKSLTNQLVFQRLILELNDLPRILHEYLYYFPDIPSIPNDCD